MQLVVYDVAYHCVPECETRWVEIYIDGVDDAFIIHKAAYKGSIRYRDRDDRLSPELRDAINREKEAWCPIHQKVLKFQLVK